MKNFYVLCAIAIAMLSCTGLSEEERYLVETKVASAAIASQFEEEFSDVVNKNVIELLNSLLVYNYTNDVSSQTLRWAEEVSDYYEDTYKRIREEFPKQIAEDLPLLMQRMEVMNQLYHQSAEDILDDKPIPFGDHSSLKINETPLFDSWNQVAMTSRWAADVEFVDNVIGDNNSYRASSILSRDLKRVDFMTENYNYLYFRICNDLLKKMTSELVIYYIHKQESSESYEVGFNNDKAYLCTFVGKKGLPDVVYKEIEYDQTKIGEGL